MDIEAIVENIRPIALHVHQTNYEQEQQGVNNPYTSAYQLSQDLDNIFQTIATLQVIQLLCTVYPMFINTICKPVLGQILGAYMMFKGGNEDDRKNLENLNEGLREKYDVAKVKAVTALDEVGSQNSKGQNILHF